MLGPLCLSKEQNCKVIKAWDYFSAETDETGIHIIHKRKQLHQCTKSKFQIFVNFKFSSHISITRVSMFAGGRSFWSTLIRISHRSRSKPTVSPTIWATLCKPPPLDEHAYLFQSLWLNLLIQFCGCPCEFKVHTTSSTQPTRGWTKLWLPAPLKAQAPHSKFILICRWAIVSSRRLTLSSNRWPQTCA